MNSTEPNGSKPREKRLNTNSYISIGLAGTLIAGILWLKSTVDTSQTDTLAKADQRYATREALDAKWNTLNEIVNARITIITERLTAVSSSIGELRSTVAGVPDLTATMKDIQRQLDRIEKERK